MFSSSKRIQFGTVFRPLGQPHQVDFGVLLQALPAMRLDSHAIGARKAGFEPSGDRGSGRVVENRSRKSQQENAQNWQGECYEKP
jgi:hypothetical protein